MKKYLYSFQQLTNMKKELRNKIWCERTNTIDTHLDRNKLANVKRYIIRINHIRNAEKDNVKDQVIDDIQWNETVTLGMNADYNETNNTLQ